MWAWIAVCQCIPLSNIPRRIRVIVAPPSLVAGSTSNLNGVYLFSDQLPGLIYCPDVYMDPVGPVYLAESFAMEKADSKQWTQARWIPASPLFTKWLQTP
jgi:hypothetical protein